MVALLRLLTLLVTVAAPCVCRAQGSKPPEAPPLHRLALVIGNGAYVNAAPLQNPANDAGDVCAALRELGFEVICKTDLATKRAFKDAIFEFTGRTRKETIALFYFAGHGVQIDGLNYLVPTGAALRTKSDIEDESVQVNYLMTEMDSRQAALNIFLFDACRDNPFVTPIRGYAPQLGLASQLYTPGNTILAMSTGPGQLSLDGSGRNGTFTRSLLKNIGTPRLAVEDMLKAVSRGTGEEARRLGRQQLPQITTSYTERYCLAGCTDAPLAASAPQLDAKTQEVDTLQQLIGQAKAKQTELDEQKNALLKKQGEVDQLRQSVERTQAGQAAQDAAQVKRLNEEIAQATARTQELDAIKAVLQRKQQELDQSRDRLAQQQASIELQDKAIQTRKIDPPPPRKKRATIVPTF